MMRFLECFAQHAINVCCNFLPIPLGQQVEVGGEFVRNIPANTRHAKAKITVEYVNPSDHGPNDVPSPYSAPSTQRYHAYIAETYRILLRIC